MGPLAGWRTGRRGCGRCRATATVRVRSRPRGSDRRAPGTPRRSARSPRSVTSRDLPMPGSPATSRKRIEPVELACLQERHRLVEHGLAADRAGGCSGVRRCIGRLRHGCRRRRRDGRRQRRVLAQHRLLEPLDLLRRVDPELLGEAFAEPAQGVERVGLPRALVLRQREQRPQSLAVGVLRRQRGQRALGVVGSTQVDERARPMLLDGQPQLLEPGALRQHEGRVAVGVRRAGPEGERLLARGSAEPRASSPRAPSRPAPRTARRRRRRPRRPVSSRRRC